MQMDKDCTFSKEGIIYTFHHMFPELKESEDENKVMEGKLREILRLCYEEGKCSLCASDYEKLLAWLEKKKELKKIKQEQTELPKGEDYAIDGLWQAIQILEHSLGEVDGWQSDDGILEHKCAIEAVKRLYEQKPIWSDEDELVIHNIVLWLKSLKEKMHLQPKHELNKGVDNEYIDLGLPSGTLWKLTNEDGYYTFDEAVEKFCDNLPSKEQWEELENKCSCEWKDNGYDVTGPNGKSIFFPTAGFRTGTCVYSDGTNGYYWSSKYVDNDNVWFMYFYDKFHSMRCDGRYYGQSVRLVK